MHLRRQSAPYWIASLILTVLLGFPQHSLTQQLGDFAVEGYVTSLQPPNGFVVSGREVTTKADTGYGMLKDKTAYSNSPLRNALQPGAYVYIQGDTTKHGIAARAILFRDDWDDKLSGTGVIDKIIARSPQLEVRADGYLIRISRTTQTDFQGNSKSISDMTTGEWLHFEGKRGRDGVVMAEKADFLPPRLPKRTPAKSARQEGAQPLASMTSRDSPKSQNTADKSPSSAEDAFAPGSRVPLSWFTAAHVLPTDSPLQKRVERVGMRLVPPYLSQLPADNPLKTDFHFYAVDHGKDRNIYFFDGGVMLVPTTVIERLKNDDQLAAMLADGIAFYMQRQAARFLRDSWLLNSAVVAGDAAGFFVPGVGLGVGLASGAIGSQECNDMQKERARIALALMSDAGYDPWQAPEAWRLLAPRKLPRDLFDLKYPPISKYELNFLYLQYSPGLKAGAPSTS
ncbi:MAG: hypothetical protein KGN79_10050 [Acidobacteriota bacterium]|nr:hypothetical protein [Acidobacteriota bacterium]